MPQVKSAKTCHPDQATHTRKVGQQPETLLVLRCGSSPDLVDLRLDKRTTTLGSDPRCTFQLKRLAPVHAIVIRGTRGTVLRAWQGCVERNGTTQSDFFLKPGDRVRMADYEWTVACDESNGQLASTLVETLATKLHHSFDTLTFQLDQAARSTQDSPPRANQPSATVTRSQGGSDAGSPIRSRARRPTWHRLRRYVRNQLDQLAASSVHNEQRIALLKQQLRTLQQAKAEQIRDVRSTTVSSESLDPLWARIEDTLTLVTTQLKSLQQTLEQRLPSTAVNQGVPIENYETCATVHTQSPAPGDEEAPPSPATTEKLLANDCDTASEPNAAITPSLTSSAKNESNDAALFHESTSDQDLESATSHRSESHVLEASPIQLHSGDSTTPTAAWDTDTEAVSPLISPITDTGDRTPDEGNLDDLVVDQSQAFPIKSEQIGASEDITPSGPELISDESTPSVTDPEIIDSVSVDPAKLGEPPTSVEEVLQRLAKAGLWRQRSSELELPNHLSEQSPILADRESAEPLSPSQRESPEEVSYRNDHRRSDVEPETGNDSAFAVGDPAADPQDVTSLDQLPAQHDEPETKFTEPTDEAEFAVQQYMERLLQRLRGTSPSPPAPDVRPAARTPESTESTEQETREERPYVPLGPPPERHVNLTAMRELALHSARNAVLAHAKRHARESTRRLLLFSGISYVLTGICWVWPNPARPWLTHLASTAGLILGTTLLLTAAFKWLAGVRSLPPQNQ